MAHKKAGGSSRNGHDSSNIRFGGRIICSKWHYRLRISCKNYDSYFVVAQILYGINQNIFSLF